jgi:hypothetical protein
MGDKANEQIHGISCDQSGINIGSGIIKTARKKCRGVSGLRDGQS